MLNTGTLSWGQDQGLPQNLVRAIAQTPDGYLWLGTDEGVARFDGASFHIFDHTNTPAITRSQTRGLHVDAQGRLWVLTAKELVEISPQGEWQRHGTGADTAADLFCLHADPAGQLWIGTLGHGLFWLSAGRLQPCAAAPPIAKETIHAICDDGAGARPWSATVGTPVPSSEILRLVALASGGQAKKSVRAQAIGVLPS